ncbi:hypothetical protein ACH5RR_034032 [Cinchona calisaya]|uniref:B3 domain-containing protein n=1 Tax=Cinchona calisaya TaxID=153742 RepID=A0ABD2YBW8_9GENT
MEKESCSAESADGDDEIFSSTEENPNWDNFHMLVEVAEQERIKLEKEESQRKLIRQSVSAFLNLDDKETAEILLLISDDKIDLDFTKGKRSWRKKISSTKRLLFFKKLKSTSIVQYEFEGKHQEDDDNPILFSHGNIIRKPLSLLSKRSRCNNYIEENSSNTDQEEEKKPKKTISTYLDASSTLHTNITIPDNFKNKIVELGGSEESLVFVFQKVLTKTDVNTNQHRLLIPLKQIKNGFLTDEEKASFQDSTQKFEVGAIFIDPSLDECRMNLRQWNMAKKNGKVSYNYSLVTHWAMVVRKNQLREGMTAHLWAFRKGSELGFALLLLN